MLLFTTTLSIYKPKELTPHGRPKQEKLAASPRLSGDSRRAPEHAARGDRVKIIAVALILLFVIVHLAGRGFGNRGGCLSTSGHRSLSP